MSARPTYIAAKNALKASLIAALPKGTEFLYGVDPDDLESRYDVAKFPRLVVLTYLGGEVSENMCIGLGNATQEAKWNWAIDVRCGASNRSEDMFDETVTVLQSIYDALFGTYPTDGMGPMLIGEEPSLVGYSAGIPVYRYIWTHEISP